MVDNKLKKYSKGSEATELFEILERIYETTKCNYIDCVYWFILYESNNLVNIRAT